MMPGMKLSRLTEGIDHLAAELRIRRKLALGGGRKGRLRQFSELGDIRPKEIGVSGLPEGGGGASGLGERDEDGKVIVVVVVVALPELHVEF